MGKMWKVLLALVLMLAVSPKISFAAQSASFDTDLKAYLKEISAIRGMTVTKEDIDKALSNYDETITDFKTVNGKDGLRSYLGEVIKADYSNLNYMKDDYNLTIDDLKSLLKENGEDISDYVFVDDLDIAVDFYLNPDGNGIDEQFDKEFINELLPLFQDEFGLTKDELTNLKNHLEGLNEKLSTPEAIAKLEQLSQRLMAFAQFDSINQLTSNQIQEFLSIYDELLSMMEVKVKFSIVKGNKEKPLSFLDLLKLESLDNAKLKASIYDLNGNLLADFIISGDIVNSGTIKHIGKDLNTATEKIKEVKKQKPVFKTVKGGQLPNTAGNYALNILLGFIIALAGIFGLRYYRKAA